MKTFPVDVDVERSIDIDDRNKKKELRKNRRKHHKLLISELCIDFAKNTTLHGLKYINERGLTIVEKVFWLLTFIISVALCSWLIRDVYTKWESRPVIVSFSERMIPVEEVPFPSVTICPQRKVKKSIYNYAEEIERYYTNRSDLSTEDIEKLHNVALLCVDNKENWESSLLANESLIKTLREVSPSIRDFGYVVCSWHRNESSCDDTLDEVLTEEGVCLNFNSLSEEDILKKQSVQQEYSYTNRDLNKSIIGWSMEGGYDKNFDISETYPKRGRGNGARPDLFITLRWSKFDYDSLCNPLMNGYKIFVHHPADMPHSSLYYYAALPGHLSSLALKFSLLSTSERLKDYESSVRQCYFPKDRQLRYFKTYTQNNCRIECKSNYTFQKCKCVTFDMPHNDSKSICTVKHMSCVREAKGDLSARESKASLGKELEACHCLPACNSITYDAEILNTEYDHKQKLRNYVNILPLFMHFNRYLEETYFSTIAIYFKEPQFVSMHRSELFGLTDFMANIGGLLGLFLGFSFLSFVEIAYFATLRICCILRRNAGVVTEDKEN